MGTQRKDVSQIKGHLTKAQIKEREEARLSLMSPNPMQEYPETEKDPYAHELFKRIEHLYNIVNRNADNFSSVINQYCKISSHCRNLEKIIKTKTGDEEIKYQRMLNGWRKILFSIDKEMGFTEKSMSRLFPKYKPVKSYDELSPMAKWFKDHNLNQK